MFSNKTGIFVIVKRTNETFQFSLRAGNRRAILISIEFPTRSSCDEGITDVRKHAVVDSNFIRLISPKGYHYFSLKVANGKIIGTSQMYKNSAACENGIASVKYYAKEANTDNYYAQTRPYFGKDETHFTPT